MKLLFSFLFELLRIPYQWTCQIFINFQHPNMMNVYDSKEGPLSPGLNIAGNIVTVKTGVAGKKVTHCLEAMDEG